MDKSEAEPAMIESGGDPPTPQALRRRGGQCVTKASGDDGRKPVTTDASR
jgi:hypothetical protein